MYAIYVYIYIYIYIYIYTYIHTRIHIHKQLMFENEAMFSQLVFVLNINIKRASPRLVHMKCLFSWSSPEDQQQQETKSEDKYFPTRECCGSFGKSCLSYSFD